METTEKKVVTVESTINAPVEKVWDYWAKPEHITQWANASDDWHTPRAENDLRTGGNRQPPVNRAHQHSAAAHADLFDLDLFGNIGGCSDQTVGARTLVFDRQVAAGGFRTLRCGAAPGL